MVAHAENPLLGLLRLLKIAGLFRLPKAYFPETLQQPAKADRRPIPQEFHNKSAECSAGAGLFDQKARQQSLVPAN